MPSGRNPVIVSVDVSPVRAIVVGLAETVITLPDGAIGFEALSQPNKKRGARRIGRRARRTYLVFITNPVVVLASGCEREDGWRESEPRGQPFLGEAQAEVVFRSSIRREAITRLGDRLSMRS